METIIYGLRIDVSPSIDIYERAPTGFRIRPGKAWLPHAAILTRTSHLAASDTKTAIPLRAWIYCYIIYEKGGIIRGYAPGLSFHSEG